MHVVPPPPSPAVFRSVTTPTISLQDPTSRALPRWIVRTRAPTGFLPSARMNASFTTTGRFDAPASAACRPRPELAIGERHVCHASLPTQADREFFVYTHAARADLPIVGHAALAGQR